MARAAANDKAGSDGASPQVSVLMVTYNSGPTLDRALAALRAQSFRDFELILVDNPPTDGAPSDGAAAGAARADPAIRLIENNSNRGFAAGMNQAAAQARGRWLALLNPDAYADPDWLARLVEATDRYPEVRSFSSRQLMSDGSGRLDGLGDVMSLPGFPYRGGYKRADDHTAKVGEVFSACGGAMLIDRDMFVGMGGFDERLFCYCEDVDLGYRLRLAGECTLVVPEAVVLHEGSTSSGGPRSEFAVFHGTRNRLWVFIKDTPPVLFWLTLPLHILATAFLFVRHAFAGEFGAPWRGLMAGLKGLPLALAARKEAQAERKVGSLGIARAMTWNPVDLWSRRVVIRRWRGSAKFEG